MPGPERLEVLARIRELLAEDQEDFFRDDRLLGSYDQGCAKQHRIVFENAERRGLLATNDADYLREFYTVPTVAATASGTQDYALPTDCFRLHRVTFGTSPERPALLVPFEDDQRIRTSPQWGPSPEQPLVAVVPPKKLRFYLAASDNGVPQGAVDYRIYYWREVAPTGKNEYVDVPEPWNEGPVFYAAALALGKERTDFSRYLEVFEAHANTIVLPVGGAP